jgi:hypothetical protein
VDRLLCYAGDQTGGSDVNGTTHPSTADGSAAAVADIDRWSVSLIGGSLFADAMGTPTGSTVFTLTP